MRQRVATAIALACDPELVFADEPTTALDVTIQRQILDLLRRLQQDAGMAMVLITHDLAVVARRTDRTMVMYAGRVAEDAPTASLFAQPRHPYTSALLGSVPRLRQEPHTRLAVIPGRPADIIDPRPGCRFAPRCAHAQPRCLAEDPPADSLDPGHTFRCFYPVGTPGGDSARASNIAEGRTAAGLEIVDGEAS
jgi:peptide/nickel transport system ATP-binding protein